METENRWIQFAKDNLLIIILAVGGLVFLGYGAYQMLGPKDVEAGVVIEKSQPGEGAGIVTSPGTEKEIVVDVEGAVEKPGIYRLPMDSRHQDALIAAGGMNKSADRSLVAKTFNMAAKLTDGMKLYIPHKGEVISVTSNSGSAVAGVATSIISINSGSVGELDSLPGVGQVTANKIISNRPYGSLEELVSKKAVSKSVFEKIKDRISL